MSRRARTVVAVAFCTVHLALLAPTIGDGSPILDNGFRIQGEAIEAGALPYSQARFEYPPGAVAPIVAPALISSDEDGYRTAFEAQMLIIDLALICLLAAFVPGPPRRVIAALATYAGGALLLSGIGPLPDSAIDKAPLALARFDLLPALFVLLAALAHAAGRARTWGAAAGAGIAVKAFPLIAVPALLAQERRRAAAAIAMAVPILIAAATVLGTGDDFWRAITFHSSRSLQVESLAASPIEIGHLLGGAGRVVIGSESFNLEGGGAEAARLATSVLMAGALVAVSIRAVRTDTPVLELMTVLIAIGVVLSPVLSPQFLLWLLPVSAAAYGADWRNALLVASAAMTQVMLASYAQVEHLEPGFVWSLAARNAMLALYLAAIAVPLWRGTNLGRNGRLGV